jgi:hypothetical protein
MPRNVEIKAGLRNREAVERIVRSRADHGQQLIEQEEVLESDQTKEEGADIARRLMAELGVSTADLEARAYVDLMT